MDDLHSLSRTRARVICVLCHERKVRCDLQNSPNRTCGNCRKMGQRCVQRQGRRNLRAAAQKNLPPTAREDSMSRSPASELLPLEPYQTGTPAGTPESGGFIAVDSVLFDESPAAGRNAVNWSDWRRTEESLQRIDCSITLKELTEPLQQALLDSFDDHLGHYFPFMASSQVQDPKTPAVLRQVLLLAGSLARHIDNITALSLPYALYQDSKRLIYASHGRDPITLLKAMCIISHWSLSPPTTVSLDGPWHWTGLAIRLALQMGLHRESTYAGLDDADGCRLIWWYLVNSDALQSACWGRPCMIQSCDYDVHLPIQSKPDSVVSQAFAYMSRLLLILREVVEHNIQPLPTIIAQLASWYNSLPPLLALYDSSGHRRPYSKPCSEMHILYFALIILISLRYYPVDKHTRPSLLAIVASSCMMRLYEEIHHHEHSAKLTSGHGFLLMLAALPQIFYQPQSPIKDQLRERELDLARAILRELRVKYGGSNMVLDKIKRLDADTRLRRQQQPDDSSRSRPVEPAVDSQLLESRQLFPLPQEMSPNLALLSMGSPELVEYDDRVLTFDSSLLDWSFDDPYLYSFPNMSGLPTTS